MFVIASPVGGQRKRPGRQAGRRYSAGRAQGGGVVSSTGKGIGPRGANEGLLGRPEAPSSTSLTIARRAGERRNNKNQPTKYSVAARILRDRIWNLLKLKANSTDACGYGWWVR